MASNPLAMAFNLLVMASNLEAMASNLEAMASNLLAMASNLEAMASNLEAMASTWSTWYQRQLPQPRADSSRRAFRLGATSKPCFCCQSCSKCCRYHTFRKKRVGFGSPQRMLARLRPVPIVSIFSEFQYGSVASDCRLGGSSGFFCRVSGSEVRTNHGHQMATLILSGESRRQI